MLRVVWDPHKKVQTPGIEQVDFDTLITTSDVVTLHVHLRPDTHHMINRDVLARMKRGVTIINVSRGDLVCEPDLLEALRSGHVSAAGLDVVHDEWDPNPSSKAKIRDLLCWRVFLHGLHLLKTRIRPCAPQA